MKIVCRASQAQACAAGLHGTLWLEKKNVVLCIKKCACAPWIGPEKKKIKDLGCAVLYLSMFPCTHCNIEGILLF